MFETIKEIIDKDDEDFDLLLYEGETIKGTNIKNGKGIEYKINSDNIIFREKI